MGNPEARQLPEHAAKKIEHRQIDHIDLLQLGKTLLLLVRRQELLVDIPATTQPAREIVPAENSVERR